MDFKEIEASFEDIHMPIDFDSLARNAFLSADLEDEFEKAKSPEAKSSFGSSAPNFSHRTNPDLDLQRSFGDDTPEVFATEDFDDLPGQTGGSDRQNQLSQGLAMITNLCMESFDRLEKAPVVLIKLRNVLMETVYYCIEVNRQVYEEFVYSIQQKSKLYMRKLIQRALKMCRSNPRSTICYHVIKCAHDITLLTFTFTNPYKFLHLLDRATETKTEAVSDTEDWSGESWDQKTSTVTDYYNMVSLVETNRSLINCMAKLKQSFSDPQTNEPINDTPRDLFRFELREILGLLDRISSILLNNCIPDEAIFSYYVDVINGHNYSPHDLESLEEYLCHFSRLQALVQHAKVSATPVFPPAAPPIDRKQPEFNEEDYNRLRVEKMLWGPKKKEVVHENDDSRFYMYQKLRQKGIEIHPRGTHNINVTTEFLRRADERKNRKFYDMAKREYNANRQVSGHKSEELKDAERKMQFISHQKMLMQNSFRELICNFPNLQWCSPLQSINYLQIFVDLYNEIYQEELVIEQKYDASGDKEETVIRRMDNIFHVKRGHYNQREHTLREVKIPDFVNFFKEESEELCDALEPGQESQEMCSTHPAEAEAEAGKIRVTSSENDYHKLSLEREEASLRFKISQRNYESRYNEAYEVLCESEHFNQTEKWRAYFSNLKVALDSDSIYITKCKIDEEVESERESAKSEEVLSDENLKSVTFPSLSNQQSNESGMLESERIPLSLKVFQLNEAVAYEVRNIRADYEDAHVTRKVEFKQAKCYKCKYFPWHKHEKMQEDF